jgi:hypothetical protein
MAHPWLSSLEIAGAAPAAERTALAALGFVTILLFPLLGVLGLLKDRAIPWLACSLAAWTAAGAALIYSRVDLPIGRQRLLDVWLLGVALGATFLAVAWLRKQRRVSRWVKLAMGVLTLCVFAKALLDFVRLYA